MITVRNRMRAPLTINIPEQSAIYFGPRETKPLTADQFNALEMQEQIEAGNIIVLRME